MIPWKIITSPVQALNSPHQALFRGVWNHIFGTLQRCSIWGEWGYRWFKCRYYHHPVSRTWIWTLNPSHGRFLGGTWTTPVFKQTIKPSPYCGFKNGMGMIFPAIWDDSQKMFQNESFVGVQVRNIWRFSWQSAACKKVNGQCDQALLNCQMDVWKFHVSQGEESIWKNYNGLTVRSLERWLQ